MELKMAAGVKAKESSSIGEAEQQCKGPGVGEHMGEGAVCGTCEPADGVGEARG